MDVTVILCTYNRCQSLVKTLERLSVSILPESIEWEVLVVDNNSKDQTHEVVDVFCRRYPNRFHYVHEPEQGLSCARNTGIRESRGQILVFTDDDIIVERDWLNNIAAPLKSGEWAGAYGRVLAANDFKRPDWLALQGQYNLGCVLALHDPDEDPGGSSQALVGANMAFRKETFLKCGPFRKDLGRSGNNLMGNEETELSQRITASGGHLLYVPTAVVYHAIPQDRLEKKYFLKFWYNCGRSEVRQTANRADVFGLPRWLFSIPLIVFGALPARLRMWLFARDPKRRFFMKCTVWKTFGAIVELPRIWLETKRRNRLVSSASETAANFDGD